MSITDNIDWVENLLTAFNNRYEFDKQQDPETSFGKSVKAFINDQVAMEKGMQEWVEYENLLAQKNKRLLNAIKSVKGKTFYKYVLQIIEEAEGIKTLAEIVNKPDGNFQREKYGRQIQGTWVRQWSVGDSGDSWEGFIYVQIKANKYLKFGYSM